jgi:hypothetical protein
MTGKSGDPEFEAERRRQMHRLRMWAGSHPSGGPEDPIHVLAIHTGDAPAGVWLYVLARWSLCARMVQDCADAGTGGDAVRDLGPDALMLCQAANRGEFGVGEMLKIGVAKGNAWVAWYPPVPAEPVPGSPGATASRN